jgi:lysophospholipase L1-like esterase
VASPSSGHHLVVRRVQLLAVALALVVTCVAGFVIVDSIATARPSHQWATKAVPRPLPAGETQVFVVGDSLTIGARPWLARDLRRLDGRLVGVNARVSRHVDEGLTVLRKMGDSLPETVMVALGTNDLQASTRQVDRWLRTARQLVGDRRLIWVNLRANATHSKLLARYHVINDALDAAAPRYGVEVADWDTWAGARHVRTLGDGIHYSTAAYRLRASFYAEVATAEPERDV